MSRKDVNKRADCRSPSSGWPATTRQGRSLVRPVRPQLNVRPCDLPVLEDISKRYVGCTTGHDRSFTPMWLVAHVAVEMDSFTRLTGLLTSTALGK